MKKLFQCEICQTLHDNEEAALACEAKGSNPLYEIHGKAIYQGDVVTINRREICPCSHKFIYMFSMKPEDNPGKILSICGWKGEDELTPLPILQACA